MESRYKEPLYNKDPSITLLLSPVMVKCMEKNSDITNILPQSFSSWLHLGSFSYIWLFLHGLKNFVRYLGVVFV